VRLIVSVQSSLSRRFVIEGRRDELQPLYDELTRKE
jgi:hypothetical protein